MGGPAPQPGVGGGREPGALASAPTAAADNARPKATVTVTLLAVALTLSYALRGLFGVGFSMVKAAAGGRDVRRGFKAAADEVMRNEERVMRMVGGGGGGGGGGGTLLRPPGPLFG